jgi:hypothetical protein
MGAAGSAQRRLDALRRRKSAFEADLDRLEREIEEGRRRSTGGRQPRDRAVSAAQPVAPSR